MRKRITSLLLVLALCLTLLPTAALAEASSLAAQEARGGTENGEDYTVGEDTAVRARTRAAATGEVYRISNADDLEAFCKRVNGGESSLNAVLVKDVSRNKNYSWESIKGYTGVFDGNGHTITLRVGGSGENNALFGSIAKGGTVQDLTIQIYNWSVNISTATGSIAYSNNGTIQRCQALDWTGEKNIGGIVYHNESEGVVKDCRVGTLTLSKSRENLVGGIAFINDGLIQDCYVSGRLQSTSSGPRGDLSSATAIVRTNSGTVENCYYLQYDGETAVAGTPVTDEAAFASGEVAYKLNGKKTETDSVWRQNLPGNKDGADADGLPVADASHGRVYYDSESGSYYSLLAHVHDGEELTAWQQADSLPDASGMYYLTGNVTLTSGQALGNDVTLCVNGHSVTGNVTVTGGSFTLTDCGSGSLTGDVTVNEGGSFTLEDCALSGKIENSGTLTVTGGTVTAADGIGVENKGTFTMNSGTITAAGTGVVNTGTLTMNGGAVTGCGKGVENSGTMDVSGDVRIAGNTNGNLLLPEGITVTVGTLDSTANIGVTAEKQGELTAGGSIRLTSGGAAYTTRFFADDAAAYAIFADGEDLIMRIIGEHTHCICGHPADGAADIGDHKTHADVTFQPWTSGNSLPTEGNYYLTQNVVLSKTTVLTGTLCLNGYSISVKDGGGPVEVSSGTLNLTDCAAQPGSVTAARDQAINVYNSGSANIFNGVIRSGSGTGIYIGPYAANANVAIYGGKITGSGTGAAANNGTMHMYGGEISGNSRGVQAGGTKGSGSFNGSFYLHGGKITDNHGSEGGGVYVMNNFYMDGGEVSYNTASGNGGGIYVFTGTASLSGGKVTGNRAGENGGGVCTKAFRDARSYVNLSGSAEISNNYAGGLGGGIYLDVFYWDARPNDYSNYCRLTMNGGSITGNTSVGDGGGVYADARSGNWRTKSVVMVEGSSQITGNKKGEEDNNLYLPGPSEGVTISGDLDETAEICVTTENKPSAGSEVTIAKKSGWVSGTVTVPDGAFKVDGADGTIRIGEDGSTVKLVPHTHVWTYALKSGTTDTVTAVCSGCNASGGSVTIKAPAELTYSGGDKEATLDNKLQTGVTVPTVTYQVKNGKSFEAFSGTPTDAGEYKASITVGSVTASVTYEIGKATPTVADFVFTAPSNLNYDGESKIAAVSSTKIGMGDVTVKYYDKDGKEAEPTNAGDYTVKIDVAAGDNYNEASGLTSGDWTFTIQTNNTAPSVTLSGDMVYTSKQIRPTVTVKIGNTTLEKDKDYTVTYGENKNAGKKTGTVTITAKGNYDFAQVVEMFDITAQIIQVTAENKSSRVGQNIVELTYTHTERLPYAGDKFSGALVTSADKNQAGIYDITQGTLTLGGNYTIIFNKGTYTVNAKDVQKDFEFAERAKTVTYGDADFTVAATGAAAGSTVTYASTDTSVATVDTKTGKVTIKGAGRTTITAKATATNDYAEGVATYELTISPKTLTAADLKFTMDTITKVYDGTKGTTAKVQIRDTAKVNKDDALPEVNGTYAYNSKDVKDAESVIFTSTASNNTNYILPANLLVAHEASITPCVLTVGTVNTTPKKYDGNNNATSYVTGIELNGTVSGETLRFYTSAETGGDYGIHTTTFDGVNVGNHQITGTVVLLSESALASNYTFKDKDGNETATAPFTATGEITEADGGNLKTVELTQKYTDTSEHTYTPDWSGLPTGQTWSYGCESSSALLTKKDVAAENGTLTYAISGGKAGDVITITFRASCNNYADFTITLTITLTEKDNQQALRVTGGTTVVYGQTLTLSTSGGSGTGAVTYTVTNGTGEATIDPNGVLTPVRVGSVTVTAAKEGDSEYNAVTSSPVEITITKATPTGTPKYTEITTSGKTLTDAALTVEGSTLKPNAGTLEWIDENGNALPGNTVIEANKTYMWRFMPTDGNYTVLTGSIELYHKSSSGGGGWYYTYHTIKATSGANGSISPSGWASVREGWDQTFTITPDKGYAVAKVLVDGKSVGAVTSYTFKNVTKDHTIEAVFMRSNGNPQTGVFVDVPENSYYEEAVDWAVENGITNGVSSDRFDSDGLCTRAQIVTFLWRAAGSPAPKSTSHNFTDVKAGSYYEQAVLWAVENGITVGTSSTTFSPDATCTRAQAVTFLYRAFGSPAVSDSAAFSDVTADAYYADAVAWAEKKGITTGIGDGLFGSNNDCTRAQIVTFLWRAMAE